MFLILEDDNWVRVYSSPEEAAAQIEPLDVEETARRMFDADARPYRVEWIRSNRSGRCLGFLRWVENGEYRFVVAGPPDAARLLEMLRSASAIDPEWQVEIKALEQRLTSQGWAGE